MPKWLQLLLLVLVGGIAYVYGLLFLIRGVAASVKWAYANKDSMYPLRTAAARGVLGSYILAFLLVLFLAYCSDGGSGCPSRPDPMSCYDAELE